MINVNFEKKEDMTLNKKDGEIRKIFPSLHNVSYNLTT